MVKAAKRNISLPADVDARLRRLTAMTGRSRSAIITEALRDQFSEDAETAVSFTAKRLDVMTRTLDRQARDIEILTETLAMFIEAFFLRMPPLQKEQLPVARDIAAQRMEHLTKSVSRRLKTGQTYHGRLMSDVLAEEFD